ncbi:MAG: helix-turn-helix domain-containing protein [Salinivirgaceae bacterium]|jgi:excisionase family DNA binding protein
MYNEKQIEERFIRLESLILLQKKKLTLKEAALYTGYKESYVYKLSASQRIPHSKPQGGAIIFDRDELDIWLSRNRIKTIDEIEEEADNFKLK